MPETCRFFDKIKFMKFVGLVGFVENKFVTMHGHVNVKYSGRSSLCGQFSVKMEDAKSTKR